jgi:Rhodopirellula transposase DDE domain
LAPRARFPHVTTLLLNQDNGPENHSRRTQFMKRLVEFAQRHQVNLQLAYYPPYHSKYNPIERTWGVLENPWNGNILSDVNTVLKFAETMTWKGRHPTVQLVTQTYPTGVKLTKPEMAEVETQIHRLHPLEMQGKLLDLGKWFINISCRLELELG